MGGKGRRDGSSWFGRGRPEETSKSRTNSTTRIERSREEGIVVVKKSSLLYPPESYPPTRILRLPMRAPPRARRICHVIAVCPSFSDGILARFFFWMRDPVTYWKSFKKFESEAPCRQGPNNVHCALLYCVITASKNRLRINTHHNYFFPVSCRSVVCIHKPFNMSSLSPRRSSRLLERQTVPSPDGAGLEELEAMFLDEASLPAMPSPMADEPKEGSRNEPEFPEAVEGAVREFVGASTKATGASAKKSFKTARNHFNSFLPWLRSFPEGSPQYRLTVALGDASTYDAIPKETMSKTG